MTLPTEQKNHLLMPRPFIQIPGPNPILISGARGEWDEQCIECCDVLREMETYYLFYHGVPKDKARWGEGSYRIGLATAPHPLGPWQKFGGRPVLDLGPPGNWDDYSVACAAILKEGPSKYLMWYSGRSKTTPWSIGLAYAERLEGPWRKHEKNPLIEDFGYVGGVVKHNGKYHLYVTHPLGSTAPDYAPFMLATADAPEGPWEQWNGNPIIPAGEKNVWDDGGYSEAKVTYWDGVFHVFYGGAKEYVPRSQTRESIGYAYSFDGYHFTKYAGNPVAVREADPNIAAFAEVHTLFEPPFIYAFHTIRYIDPKRVPMLGGRTTTYEDLGVQVLVMQTPFRLPMPILTCEPLLAGRSTELSHCRSVSLAGVRALSLTVECEFELAAQNGIRVHLRSSTDGLNYDTCDLMAFDLECRPGQIARKTVPAPTCVRYLKAIIENLDKGAPCRMVKLTATLGG